MPQLTIRPQSIASHNTTGAFDLKAILADTPIIEYGNFRGGQIEIPTGSSITSLTFYTSTGISGQEHKAAYDSFGATVTISGISADRSYPIPEALFGATSIKIKPNANGTVYISFKG